MCRIVIVCTQQQNPVKYNTAKAFASVIFVIPNFGCSIRDTTTVPMATQRRSYAMFDIV